MPTTTACPNCGKKSIVSDNPYRPFCSRKCKMVDLAAWITDKYSIAFTEEPDMSDSQGAIFKKDS